VPLPVPPPVPLPLLPPPLLGFVDGRVPASGGTVVNQAVLVAWAQVPFDNAQ
jgi:hypothetical protein